MVVPGGRLGRIGPLGRIALASIAALVLAGGPGPHAAAAIPPDALQDPYVDVAEVAPAPSTAGDPPRLLAVRPPDASDPGTIHVALLVADGPRWTIHGGADIATGLSAAGTGRLVPLGSTFALVASDPTEGRTFVGLLGVDGSALVKTGTAIVAAAQVGTGAVDVDGDRTPELVLIGRASLAETDCTGRTLVVLDGRTLSARLTANLGPVAIDGAAFGHFGPGRGDDLVAYVHRSCAFGTVPSPDGLLAIDLATGRTRQVLDWGGGEATPLGPLIPIVADLDRDGIDDPIVRRGNDPIVLDPAHDWSVGDLTQGGMPFAVVDPRGPAWLAIDVPDAGGAQSWLGLISVARPRGGGDPTAGDLVRLDPRPRPQSTRVSIPGLEQATDPTAPPPVWGGDLAGDGCTELVVPDAIFRRCPADPSGWQAKDGPAWLQALPLLAYGEVGSRRLLVAAGVGWSTDGFGLAVPAPAIDDDRVRGGPGRWRSGPSSPFVLELLDATDVGYFEVYPAPAVDIDPNLTGDTPPQMILGGGGGDRVFVRLSATGPVDPAAPATTGGLPATPPDPGDYLISQPAPGSGRVALMPVPDASTAGANPGAAFVPIPDGAASGASGRTADTTAAWAVQALSLNAYGEPSTVAVGVVTVDRTGPNVVVDPPFLSAPWPFSAPIRGVAEPGARVRLGDGPYVDAARNGTFELRAQLAPWPQDLLIQAVDQRGNRTTQTLSVVGGLDYRRLPWQAVLISAVLLGAAITTWGGPSFLGRRVAATGPAGPRRIGATRSLDGPPGRPAQRRSWPDLGPEATAEIEDLPTPPTRRS